MKIEEKAKIILEALDEYICIDWNFEDIYTKAITNGLISINKKERTA